MTYTEGSAPEEADETAKAPVSSTGVVAKPKAVSSEIGGQVDTQPITWPPTASLSPEDWSESLFLEGPTNWYRCLSLRVKTQPPHVLILHLSLRITDLRHPSRREFFLCAAATATKHESYTYQLWGAEANEWEVWHSLKRFGGVRFAEARFCILCGKDFFDKLQSTSTRLARCVPVLQCGRRSMLLTSHGMGVVSLNELQITHCELRITNYELQDCPKYCPKPFFVQSVPGDGMVRNRCKRGWGGVHCWKGCWKGVPALEGGVPALEGGGGSSAGRGGVQALEGGSSGGSSRGSSAGRGFQRGF